MSNEMLFIRAEHWLDDVYSRQASLLKRISAERDRVIKAKMAADPNAAISAIAAVADDLAWTMASCQMGAPGRIVEHKAS